MKFSSTLAGFAMAAAALLGPAPAVFGQAPATPATPSVTKSALDKPTLEAYLRHMELWIPQVSVKIDDPKPSTYLPGYSEVVIHLTYQGQGKDERYLVSTDGKSVIKGEAFDINKSPFRANLDRLKTDLQPSYGTPGAPVVLVVFGDFQCPLCKVEADVMRANLVKTFGEKVRVYFKDFPLESIHPWARPASIAGRCVFGQNAQAFWSFHDWIYKDQQTITAQNLNEQIMKWAGTAGIDPIQLGRCMESKATDAEVARNMAEGTALGVDATPTTFINGRKLVGALEWPVVEQLVSLEVAHQAQSPDAGEDCGCTVNIPSVLPAKPAAVKIGPGK